MLLTIIVFILILCVLVLIHEAGHFFMAKKLGIKVEEFGFGFPPRVWGKKIGETLYSLNLLPIGGFVKLYGEDEAGGGSLSLSKNKKQETKNIDRAFFARPAWQRALVVVMGVVMNFLLGAVIISFLFATVGMPKVEKGLVVTEILKNTPAQASHLKVGDIILSANNHQFTTPLDLVSYTKQHLGKEVILSIKTQKGSLENIKITPRVNYPKNEGAMGIGIDSNIVNQKLVWYKAIFQGFVSAFENCWLIIVGIGIVLKDLFFTFRAPAGLAGPVGIAELTGQFIKIGPDAVLSFVSLLSLNLAVLNILPIPALDGGRLFFILFEMITGKKIKSDLEAKIHGVGMFVLFALIILITIHDVGRLVSGQPILK